MKDLFLRMGPLVCIAIALASCGNNETAPEVQSFGPPTGLRALSAGKSAVRLEWNAAAGASDTTFAGYLVRRGTRQDSTGKTTLTFLADSLPPGEAQFTVLARRTGGQLSDAATIRWAPAERFEDPVVVTEMKGQGTAIDAGLHVGTQLTQPSTVQVTTAAQQSLDLFLYGGIGGYAEALELRSASLYTAGWRATKFSTVTHPFPSLDYFLTAFPSSSTFTLDSAPVQDNTIYYVRLIGENQTVIYARLHVHLKSGAGFPSRAIEVLISLQRVPGLLYAAAGQPAHTGRPA